MKPIIRPELFNLKSEPDYYNCGEHGNCFHTAFVLFLQLVVGNTLEPDFEDAWLCHGTVIDDLDDTKLIDAEHWPTIRAKRGSLSGEAALEAISDLRERLKHMEMEPA